MEKFAVDLDRVLDEFELNEDLAQESTSSCIVKDAPVLQNYVYTPYVNVLSEQSDVPYSIKPVVILQNEANFETKFEPSDNGLDLSDADFAAAPFTSSSKVVKSEDLLSFLPPANAASSTEAPSSNLDLVLSLSPVHPEQAHNVLQKDAIEPLVDESPISHENRADERDDDAVGTITTTIGNVLSTEERIRALHCDEMTINKKYVTSFGHKRDPPAPVRITTDSDVISDDCANPDEDEISAIPDDAGDVSVTSAMFCSCAASSSSTDDTFTTPDDGGVAADRVLVGFDQIVEVTDEDLKCYLDDGDDDERVKEDCVGETGSEFFTPTSDNVEPVSEKSGSLAVLDENFECCVSQADMISISSVKAEPEDQQESELPNEGLKESLNTDFIEHFEKEEQIVRQVEISSETLLDVESEKHEDVIASNQNAEHELINDGDDNDEGMTDDMVMNGPQRLQRPTSLHLPGKIEVVTPSEDSKVDEEEGQQDDQGQRPFASLMATEGSPDAGLGISPASSDESEIPVSNNLPRPVATEEQRRLGRVAPVWVPDAEAPNCMQCDTKFTVIKRRHHCRACGKVLCAQCCGTKAKLYYMDNKEARVCQYCLEIMQKVQLLESCVVNSEGEDGGNVSTGSSADHARSSNCRPNPNNPSEYCSVIPPLQQARANANAPPPTVMVPVGVLKRGGGKAKGEPKQVMFSDGIRPGGDLTELDGPEPRLPYRRQGRLQKKVERSPGQVTQVANTCRTIAEQREYTLDDNLDMDHMMNVLKDESAEPVIFILTKNLKVLIKIINLDCCIHRICWSFTTKGLGAVGQDEIVILLEVLPDEKTIPYDIFYHLIDIYDEAGKGNTVSGMGHTIFTRSFLESKDHGGFLYVRPTFQCLHKIPLPNSPVLFGILLQKWEIPWAKVFPLRLLLRLGAEFRYYPCPLVGIRFRKPVYCEIGHTIVNLLADFRNFQYTVPSIPGLVIHMEDKQTFINFPRNRYDEVVKALNSSIDHVLALAACFSSKADSHLVCMQNEDGNYQTQAINIKDKPRKVTGASFVVFNGALKSSSGLTAKSSIVEDGLMVQIPGESMLALRQALRDMKDYTVLCGAIGAEQPDEVVHIQWTDDDRNVNIGVTSPIDGMSMDGISSIRIHCGTDYVGEGYLVRWTEVYLIQTEENVGSRRSDPVDISKVSYTLAQACCVALAPHLGEISAAGIKKIGLRVTLDPENVGYEIGSAGERLPSNYMNDLDSELVPAMHCSVSPTQEGSIVLELIFHILQQ